MLTFPRDFLFVCSTSAYQVEGRIENDWSAWEEAGRLIDPQARCGFATDHWNRFESDFDLLVDLGANAYRLSVEWARVEPEPGKFDEAALDRYREMVAALRRRNIEPVLTLLHFTHPRWFHESCPWHDPDGGGPDRFRRFVERVAGALGRYVRWYTILNEPTVWLLGGYLSGVSPPGHSGVREMFLAAQGLIQGYVAAREVIRQHQPAAMCGLAHNVVRFAPDRPHDLGDRLMTRAMARLYNHAFPDVLTTGELVIEPVPGLKYRSTVAGAEGTMDFLGLNYYTRVHLRFDPFRREGGPGLDAVYDDRSPLGVSDLGWEIHPEGLSALLGNMKEYGVPLLITENGLDDRNDSRRSRYLFEHLRVVLQAAAEGVDVRGYLHWSLMDNFEWLEAFEPRFGLYQVDYESMERRPTGTASVFRAIADRRGLPLEPPEIAITRGRRRSVLAPELAGSADALQSSLRTGVGAGGVDALDPIDGL